MAAHMVDSSFFNNYNTNVGSTDNWYLLYSEMRNMAYDTTQFITDENLFESVTKNALKDTIPLGLMAYDFYTLEPNALITNTYFNFDTINDILTDKFPRPAGPCGLGPYCNNTLFAGSPMIRDSKYSTVNFKFSPENFLRDNYQFSIEQNLGVDFGDGTGWHTIDPFVTTTINIKYKAAGKYQVKFTLLNGGSPNPNYLSISTITIMQVNQYIEPDYTIDLEGISVGVFEGCNPDGINRALIYLEAFDPLDFDKTFGLSNDPSEVYSNIIRNNELDELKRYGYSFYVVNWDNSRIDIRDNANYVINLINYLKSTIPGDEQFVMAGESMGGLVARYALTKMEYDGEDHRTRLMITIDSPHGGANMPLSFQHLYRDVFDATIGSKPFQKLIGMTSRQIGTALNVFLDSKAARQMLIYHVNGESINSAGISTYTGDKAKDIFFADLASIGNYPKYCKNLATTNGSMSGDKQTRAYDETDRIAGDKLFDFKGEIYYRILWFKILLIKSELDLRTNFNGQIYKFTAGNNKIKIKLKWFKVKINVVYNPWFTRSKNAQVKDFCVNSGGVYQLGLQPKAYSNDYTYDIGIFQVTSNNNGDGLFSLDAQVTTGWVSSLNVAASIYSDGFHFNFIPVQSALDIQNFPNNPLDIDLTRISIQDLMSITPFDVVIGNNNVDYIDTVVDDGHNIYYYYFYKNYTHLYLRNDNLNKSLNTCSVDKFLINTEIGDDELWINNLQLNRTASFRSAYDINIDQNPYFKRQSFSSSLERPVCYSKENLFFTLGGNTEFIYESSFNLNQPITGSYSTTQIRFSPCCNLQLPRETLLIDNSQLSTILLYPNPSENLENIKIKTNTKDENIIVTVYDLTGKLLASQSVPNKGVLELSSFKINLNPGMYLIKLISKTLTETQTFIIQ